LDEHEGKLTKLIDLIKIVVFAIHGNFDELKVWRLSKSDERQVVWDWLSSEVVRKKGGLGLQRNRIQTPVSSNCSRFPT